MSSEAYGLARLRRERRTDGTITSSPSVVRPLITTCASSFERAPITTFAPTMQYDRSRRPWQYLRRMNDALDESLVQDGRIVGSARRIGADRENIISPLHASLPSTVASTETQPMLRRARSMRVSYRAIARHDGPAKLHFVDADEIDELCAPCRRLEHHRAPSCATLRPCTRPEHGLPGKWPVNIGSWR